ncbi:acetyltransferase [Cyanobacteria bacterium FACHB-63]|nr:acetyltransferase [Cyanobacteria bacterium FACHB-63]
MLSNTLQYAYQSYDASINQTIAFRPVVLEQDLSLIHFWMNQPHVIPFWKLAFDLERMRAHLEKAIADPHQTLYIGCLNNVPMSYWESYWAADDIVARCYPTHPADQGIHLLIGSPEFLGKGHALPLLQAMVMFQFQHSETQKIIAEPDIRNQKMIHVFRRCGFEFQTEIELPDKRAALMFCERQRFFGGSK